MIGDELVRNNLTNPGPWPVAHCGAAYPAHRIPSPLAKASSTQHQCFHERAATTVKTGQSRAVNCEASLPACSKNGSSGSPTSEVRGNSAADPSDSAANRRRRRSPARSDPANPLTWSHLMATIALPVAEPSVPLKAHQAVLDNSCLKSATGRSFANRIRQKKSPLAISCPAVSYSQPSLYRTRLHIGRLIAGIETRSVSEGTITSCPEIPRKSLSGIRFRRRG